MQPFPSLSVCLKIILCVRNCNKLLKILWFVCAHTHTHLPWKFTDLHFPQGVCLCFSCNSLNKHELILKTTSTGNFYNRGIFCSLSDRSWRFSLLFGWTSCFKILRKVSGCLFSVWRTACRNWVPIRNILHPTISTQFFIVFPQSWRKYRNGYPVVSSYRKSVL